MFSEKSQQDRIAKLLSVRLLSPKSAHPYKWVYTKNVVLTLSLIIKYSIPQLLPITEVVSLDIYSAIFFPDIFISC